MLNAVFAGFRAATTTTLEEEKAVEGREDFERRLVNRADDRAPHRRDPLQERNDSQITTGQHVRTAQ